MMDRRRSIFFFDASSLISLGPLCFGLFICLLDETFNFSDNPREIRTVKTVPRCWNAVTFHVWLDMFMVRERGL